MARENTTRFAILGMLSLQPMSGYDIKQHAENTIAHFWNESYGQIYPVLKALAADGLARELPEGQGGGRANRRVYEITPAGQEALRTWLMEDSTAPRVRSEILLKVFFGRQIGAAAMAERLRAFIPQIEAKLKVFAGIEQMLERDSTPDQPYWMITLRQGILGHQSHLAWLKESIARLEVVAARETT